MAISDNISGFFSRISLCKSKVDILSVMNQFFASIGVTYYNYTHLDPSPNGTSQYIMHHNYPQSWVQQYQQQNYGEIDPAIFMARMENSAFSWHEACKTIEDGIKLGKHKKTLLQDMKNGVQTTQIDHAIAIPIVFNLYKQYGFYLAFGNNVDIHNLEFKVLISSICFAVNNSMITIERETVHNTRMQKYEKFPFTERETIVLKHLCNGKTREDISHIMNISQNTVDTLLKRIYLRARVNSILQLMVIIQLRQWWRIIFTN